MKLLTNIMILATSFFLATNSLGAPQQVTPPQPVYFSCPSIPNTFKIGGVFETDNPYAIWDISTINSPILQAGSVVTIETKKGDKPVTFNSGAVYDSIFGRTLTCYGSFKTDNVIYHAQSQSQVFYKNCAYQSSTKKFRCDNPS